MLHQSLITSEILHQFGAAGWKCQSGMEMGLVNRQRRVDGRAPTMNDSGARESEMNQPGPEKVERHLVSHPLRPGRDPTQNGEIIGRRLGKKWLLVTSIARAMPYRSTLIPEIQLASRPNLRMTGNNLLDERSTGTRHTDDQDWRHVSVTNFRRPRDQFRRTSIQQETRLEGECGQVE